MMTSQSPDNAKLPAILLIICDTSADVAATHFMHIIVVAKNVRDYLVWFPLRCPAGKLVCEPVCDPDGAISICRDSSNLSAAGRKPGLRPALELVREPDSWIV